MNLKLSPKIYAELITGRYINKTVGNIDNPLFIELVHNLSSYEDDYEKMGYILNYSENYFYLSKEFELDFDEEIKLDKTSLKEMAIMICIHKYLIENKIDLNRTIMNYAVGIAPDIITKIFEIEKYISMVERADIRTDSKAVVDLITKRNILEKNQDGYLCATAFGIHYIRYIESRGDINVI